VSVNHLDDLSLAGIDQHDLLADRKIPIRGEFGIGAYQFFRYRL
jgi:hypothetical protein